MLMLKKITTATRLIFDNDGNRVCLMSNNSGDDSLKPSADSSGARRARLQDVAALAGVSVKTTSRVLSGLRTSPGSATSVLAAAKFLRYRPNTIARELRSGAVSSGVGMIVSDLSNPFYSKMASAAERVLAKENLELFIASTNEDPEKEEGLVHRMLERRSRALLLVPSAQNHSYLQFELALGTNIVFLDRPPVNLLADSIVGNDRAAASSAMGALSSLHPRVGVIGDRDIAWTARERLIGVRQSPGFSEAYLRTGAHRAQEARSLALELLTMNDPPTALLGLNNLITLGILMALQDTGQVCSVMGFDDSEVLGLLGVSAVGVDPEKVGEQGAMRALARIHNPDESPVAIVLEMETMTRTPLDKPIQVPRWADL